MLTLKSFAAGEWEAGTGRPRTLRHAVTEEPTAEVSSEGIDFYAMLDYGQPKAAEPPTDELPRARRRCEADGWRVEQAPRRVSFDRHELRRHQGGAEKLGGIRSLHRYMQRFALQEDRERFDKLLAPTLE